MNRFLMVFAAVSLFGCDPGPVPPGEYPVTSCTTQAQSLPGDWEPAATAPTFRLDGDRVQLGGELVSPGSAYYEGGRPAAAVVPAGCAPAAEQAVTVRVFPTFSNTEPYTLPARVSTGGELILQTVPPAGWIVSLDGVAF